MTDNKYILLFAIITFIATSFLILSQGIENTETMEFVLLGLSLLEIIGQAWDNFKEKSPEA